MLEKFLADENFDRFILKVIERVWKDRKFAAVKGPDSLRIAVIDPGEEPRGARISDQELEDSEDPEALVLDCVAQLCRRLDIAKASKEEDVLLLKDTGIRGHG